MGWALAATGEAGAGFYEHAILFAHPMSAGVEFGSLSVSCSVKFHGCSETCPDRVPARRAPQSRDSLTRAPSEPGAPCGKCALDALTRG